MADNDCNYDKQQPDPCDRTKLRYPRRSDPCLPKPEQSCLPDLTNVRAPERPAEQDVPAIEYEEVSSAQQTVSCPASSEDYDQYYPNVVVAPGYAKKTIALPRQASMRTAAILAAQNEVDATALAYAYAQLSCRYGNAEQSVSCSSGTYATATGVSYTASGPGYTAAANTHFVKLTGTDNEDIYAIADAEAAANAAALAYAKAMADCSVLATWNSSCTDVLHAELLGNNVASCGRSATYHLHLDDLSSAYVAALDINGEYVLPQAFSDALEYVAINPSSVSIALASPPTRLPALLQTYDTPAWDINTNSGTYGPVQGELIVLSEARSIPADLITQPITQQNMLTVYPEVDMQKDQVAAYIAADCRLVNSQVQTDCYLSSDTVDNEEGGVQVTVCKPAYDIAVDKSTTFTVDEGAYSWPVPPPSETDLPDPVASETLRNTLVSQKTALMAQVEATRSYSSICRYDCDPMVITCDCDFAGVVDCVGANISRIVSQNLKAGQMVWFTHNTETWLGILETTIPGYRPDEASSSSVQYALYPYPLLAKTALVSTVSSRYVVVKEGEFQGSSVQEANELAKAYAFAQLDCQYANPEITTKCGWDTSIPLDPGEGHYTPRSFYRSLSDKADVYFVHRDLTQPHTLVSDQGVYPSVLWSDDEGTTPAGVVVTNCILTTLQVAYDMAKQQRSCLWCNPYTPGECEDTTPEGIQSVSQISAIPECTYNAPDMQTAISVVQAATAFPDNIEQGTSSACLYDSGDVILEAVDTHTCNGTRTYIGYLNYLHYLTTGKPIAFKYKYQGSSVEQWYVVKRFAILPYPMAVNLATSTATMVKPAGSVQVEQLQGELPHVATQRAVTLAIEDMLASFSVNGSARMLVGAIGLDQAGINDLNLFDESAFLPRSYKNLYVPLETTSLSDSCGEAMLVGYTHNTISSNWWAGAVITLDPVSTLDAIDNPGFITSITPAQTPATNSKFSTWRPSGDIGHIVTNNDVFRFYRHIGDTEPPTRPLLFLEGYETGSIGLQTLAANQRYPQYEDGTEVLIDIWKLIDVRTTQRRTVYEQAFSYTPPLYVQGVPRDPAGDFFDLSMTNLVSKATDVIGSFKVTWFPHTVGIACTAHKSVLSDISAADIFDQQMAEPVRYAHASVTTVEGIDYFAGLENTAVEPTVYTVVINPTMSDTALAPLSATQAVEEATPVEAMSYRSDKVYDSQLAAVQVAFSTAFAQTSCEWSNPPILVKCQEDDSQGLANYAELAAGVAPAVTSSLATVPFVKFPTSVTLSGTMLVVENNSILAPAGTVTLASKTFQQGTPTIELCAKMTAYDLASVIDCSVGNRPVRMACHTEDPAIINGAPYFGYAYNGDGACGHAYVIPDDLADYDDTTGLAIRNWYLPGYSSAEWLVAGNQVAKSIQQVVEIPEHQFTARTMISEYGGPTFLDLQRAIDLQAVNQAQLLLSCALQLPAKEYKCSDNADWAEVNHGSDDTFLAPTEVVTTYKYGDITAAAANTVAEAASAVRDVVSKTNLQCEIKSAIVQVDPCVSVDSTRGAEAATNLVAMLQQGALSRRRVSDGSLVPGTSLYSSTLQYVVVGAGFTGTDIVDLAHPTANPAPTVSTLLDGNGNFKQEHVKLNAQAAAQIFGAYNCNIGNDEQQLSSVCWAGTLSSQETSIAANTVTFQLVPGHDALGTVGGVTIPALRKTAADALARQTLDASVSCSVSISGIKFSCFDCSHDGSGGGEALSVDELGTGDIDSVNGIVRIAGDTPLTAIKCSTLSDNRFSRIKFISTTLEDQISVSLGPSDAQKTQIVTAIKALAAKEAANGGGCADQAPEPGCFVTYLQVDTSPSTEFNVFQWKAYTSGGTVENSSYQSCLSEACSKGTTGSTVFVDHGTAKLSTTLEALTLTGESSVTVGDSTHKIDTNLWVDSITHDAIQCSMATGDQEKPEYKEWTIGTSICLKDTSTAADYKPDAPVTTSYVGSVTTVERAGVSYKFHVSTVEASAKAAIEVTAPNGQKKTTYSAEVKVAQHLSGCPYDTGIAPTLNVYTNLNGIKIQGYTGCGATTLV